MDITLNEEQDLIASTALAFSQEHAPPATVRELETTENGFDPTVWKKMVEMGWPAAALPERYGGAGLGLMELSLIIEALGQASLPCPLFSTVIEAGLLLVDAADEAQKSHWLSRITSGEALLTVAMLEESGRMAPEDIALKLTPRGDTLVLQGTKLFVRDAGVADAIICVARSGQSPSDLSLVLVPADTPGIRRARMTAAGGEALWQVAFNDVSLPGHAMVGRLNAAWQPLQNMIARGAALKAAELTGIGQAALDLTVNYARQRIQFDRPIGSFQGVQHHCAEMARDLAVTRLLARQAAARIDRARDARREVSIAKAKASEAIPALTRTAHQIHGAVGYYRDYPLELAYHRAIAAAASYGTAADHRRALAQLLRDDPRAFRGENP
ncbi:MAG: acyl-CoA dehydrogenase family protein [Betaproteobacteria bacterium]